MSLTANQRRQNEATAIRYAAQATAAITAGDAKTALFYLCLASIRINDGWPEAAGDLEDDLKEYRAKKYGNPPLDK